MKYFEVSILFLLITFILVGCDSTNEYKESLNEYLINVNFLPEKNKIVTNQTVIYRNNEKVSLKDIYFHIYPNAFKEENTTPYDLDSYLDGFDPGYINVKKVSIVNNNIDYLIQGEDQTILKLPLSKELNPNEKIEILFEYEVVIPHVEEKFGYGSETFNISNWYPIAAVYDEKGWNLDPYYNIGDPFYSDTSFYEVKIIAPKDYIIASSGYIVEEKDQRSDNNKTWIIKGEKIRDFAWAASANFIIKEKYVDGVLIKNYFLNDNEQVNNYIANVSYNAFKTYNKLYGHYPQKQLSVVTANVASAMEYPGMVFIWESNRVNKSLEISIAHEIAHQWWYSIVGNDEVNEAWLDESFAIYSVVLYYYEFYGSEQGTSQYNTIVSNYNTRKFGLEGNEEIIRSLPEFNNWNNYIALLSKGVMFLHEINETYGKETLYSIFKEYYTEFKFRNATTDDFIKICEDITGDDFSELVDEWLYNK